MAETIKTTLTTYRFNVDDPEQAERYAALRAKLSKDRECFNVLADPRKGRRDGPKDGPIEIETAHLFGNQWNTTAGDRVFAWYEGIYPNKAIKQGHYIDITPELREALRNTVVCGYCGHQEQAAKGNVFCTECLDSAYLKKEDLRLLRMLPVDSSFGADRKPLTEAEASHLMPQYIERQTTGATSRNAAKLRKQRADIESKCAKGRHNLQTERDGMIWLMDNGISVDNVLYYSHTEKFSFGWRTPVSDEVAAAILEVISEFPFPYEIKGATRTWEGY